MYFRTGISESFYCVNSLEFSASLSKMYGCENRQQERGHRKDRLSWNKKIGSSKYIGKTMVRNGKSKRKYKNNNKGRKILSAVDVH